MEDLSKRSIIDMARGAIKERVDYEMTRVVENILDPNTSATAARKITITLNLKPDDTRQNIAVSCVAKSTLAATNPVTTALYVADEESIVKMIRTEAIHLADVNTPALFVNIPSPTNVVCFSQPDYEQRCHRTVYYSADATDVPGWDAKVTLGFEEAQIALRTRFQETPDSLYAMKLVNDISLGAKVIYNDNGVATTVTTQKGVALQTNEQIRPIVKLRPYRTFQEVEQPESTFLIRISDRGISFIEADGGMWRLTARNTIKAFLEENLAAEIESGKLVVAL